MRVYFVLFLMASTLSVYGYAGGCFSCCGESDEQCRTYSKYRTNIDTLSLDFQTSKESKCAKAIVLRAEIRLAQGLAENRRTELIKRLQDLIDILR